MLLTSLKKSLKGNYSICQSSDHCHVATKSMKARCGNPFGFTVVSQWNKNSRKLKSETHFKKIYLNVLNSLL